MKPFFALLLLLPLCTCVKGQKAQRQIEVIPFLRFDKYPEFTYAINSVNWNSLKMNGTSWGAQAAYKHPFSRILQLKAGLGYYKYSFNRIQTHNSLAPAFTGSGRTLNYPSDVYIVFATPKYWYNCLSANVGVDRPFYLKNGFEVVGGAALNSYFTFSQHYYIDHEYPVVPRDHKYRRASPRFFGFSALVHAGIQKRVKKLSVGPDVSLPVYDIWKQDNTFPRSAGVSESNSDSRSKWFKGVAIGISCNYTLPVK